jgi:putative two-component system response regulator
MTTETNIATTPTPAPMMSAVAAQATNAEPEMPQASQASSGRTVLGPPNEATKLLAGNILIIDDEPANVVIARKHLERAGYHSFKTTTDSTVAYNLIQASKPDVVLLDINMPEVSGIEILKQVRANEETRQLPVLILTANDDYAIKVVCLELGATDFLIKPVDPMELVPRVRNSLQNKSFQDRLQRHAKELERKVLERTRELELSRCQAIYCLARAAELRDNDTGNHVIRVGRFAGIIAKNLGFPDTYVNDIELAAQLHDVGKIAIPDAILLKPGKLEQEEFEIIQGHVKHGRNIIEPYVSNEASVMRSHVERGSEMLDDGSSLMRLAATIAQTHHEKYDGSGYPIGLAGEDIPIEGRITAVADVFDALSSERAYKKALPRQQCFDILEEGRGKHFDPQVLDAFFTGSADIVKIQVEFMDCE